MDLHDMTPNNQALAPVYNLLGQLSIEAQELFTQKTYQFMRQRNNTSYYAFFTFKGFYEMALRYGLSIENSSILEIGAGKPLGTGIFWNFAGARKYTSVDRFTEIKLDELWISRFESILEMNLFNPNNFYITSIVERSGGKYILKGDRIELVRNCFESYPMEGKCFDLIYSNAVLEHVADMEIMAQKMRDGLSDNGLMIHQIDLREHHTPLTAVPDKDSSIDYLRYSAEEWNKMYPPGSEHYINRLRASDFERYFKEAGFEIIESVTTPEMELDETVYDKIHPEFHRYSVDDLKRTGMRVVLKKA